ncbi:MAG: glycosyltransferase family 2 protein [Nitrospiraceae bacterium]
MPRPTISVIVVNWNGRDLLEDCLASLCSQRYEPCELIVVDNGSTDGSAQFIRDRFPTVKLVALAANTGFTGGNAAGLQVSRGEFIALINNDTRAAPTWLEHLIQPMLADPRIGICASKLIIEGSWQIDSSGDGLGTGGVGFKRGTGREATQYALPEDVFGACAAAALYRNEMLDAIGFLDEDFFFNDEDADLNFRAQLAGWTCRYVPSAVVYHKVNATIGRLSDAHVYYHHRNLEFLWVKNMPAALMLRFFHHKLIQEIGGFCYICLRHGKWRTFFRAKRDALKMLPRMLKKRRSIQRHKRVPNDHIKAMLTPIFSHELFWQKFALLTGWHHERLSPNRDRSLH